MNIDAPEPPVSAIVPARNEEGNIAKCVASLLSQDEIREVIVVDDESTDGTRRVLHEMVSRHPSCAAKLRVIEAGPLPSGWVGKNHAAWVGAHKAAGQWLLFTDADAVHLPGSAKQGLAEAAATGARLVSYSPAQEMQTWWERMLIPFIYCRLSQLYSYTSINDPESPRAAANGQYLLIHRQAYLAFGGHAAVSAEILEDVAIALRAKEAGIPIWFGPGERIARVRMYTSFAAMWEGWTKNLAPLLGEARQGITREIFSVVPWIPLVCLSLGLRHLIFGALGVLLLAGRHASYAALLRRNRFPLVSVIYYLPAVALYCAALLASDLKHERGRVGWKGREYRAHPPEV